MRFKKVFWILGLFLGILGSSLALEPKLLWKMKIPSGIRVLSLAKESCDVIFIPEGRREIILIDKNGNTRWQWGPDLERMPGHVSISDDGRYLVFQTDFSAETDAPTNPLIHFYDRNKGEIWKKGLDGYPTISPDGKYVFVNSGWEGAIAYFLDSKGNILWRKVDTGGNREFSPDGNFIWTNFYLLDRNGNIVLDALKKEIPGTLRSISANAEYLAFQGRGVTVTVRDKDGRIIGYGKEGGIFDKRGNLILEGRAMVSGDGRIGVIHTIDKIKIYKLPEKSLIKEYPIKKAVSFSVLSYNGDVIITGAWVDSKSPADLIIIDLSKNEVFKKTEDKTFDLEVSKDGKYFLLKRRNMVYFYEIQ